MKNTKQKKREGKRKYSHLGVAEEGIEELAKSLTHDGDT